MLIGLMVGGKRGYKFVRQIVIVRSPLKIDTGTGKSDSVPTACAIHVIAID